MKKSLFITAAILILAAGVTFGQRNARSNTGRQQAQQSRIADGVRSGELTRRVAVALEREQKKIQVEKKMAKADGQVTPAEKRYLRREQNRASKHIARQKNDAQDRR